MKIAALIAAATLAVAPAAALAGGANGNNGAGNNCQGNSCGGVGAGAKTSGTIRGNGSVPHSCSVTDANLTLNQTNSATLAGQGSTQVRQNGRTEWTLTHTGTTAPAGSNVTTIIAVDRSGNRGRVFF